MWKRWISGLIMFLSIGFFIKAGNATPTVSIPDVEVSRNDSYISIPINVDNAQGVAGVQFTVNFDPAILQATVPSKGGLIPTWGMGGNSYNINNVEGWINVATYNPDAEGLPAGGGSFVLLNFNIIGIPGSNIPLNFTLNVLTDEQGGGIEHNITNGSLKIEGYFISGKVTLEGGTGLVTETVITLGVTPQGLSKNGVTETTSPDSSGNYTFSGLLGEQAYWVLPNLAGYSFSPMSRDYSFGGRQPAGKQNYDDITDANFVGEEEKEPATFEVINDDGYGDPSPAVDTHNYFVGNSITASVTSPFEGVDGERFVCTGWTGTGSVPTTGDGSSVTFTITENSSIAWLWKKEYRLTTITEGNGTITQNPLLNGTTSKSVSTVTWYDVGTTVQLTAVADEGWIFKEWVEYMTVLSKTGFTSDNLTDVTMDGPKVIKAVFLKEEPVLSVTPTELEFVLVNENSKSEDVTISNTGAVGDLNWQVGEIVYQQGDEWLQVVPTEGTLIPAEIIPGSKSAGTNSCNITITATKGELTGGTYNATIPITSNGGSENILVKMVIIQQPEIVEPLDEDYSITEEFPFVPFTSQFFRSETGGTANCDFEIEEKIEFNSTGKVYPGTLIYELKGVNKTLNDQNIVKLIAPWGLFKPDKKYRWRVSDNDMGEYAREESNDKGTPITNPLWSDWSGFFAVERYIPEVDETDTDFLNSFSEAEIDLRIDGAHPFKDPRTGELLMATYPECSTGTGNVVVELLNPENVEGTDALDINYMFDVRIELDAPGATATFDLLIPGDFNGGIWKYNPDTNELLIFDDAEIRGTVINNEGNKYTVVKITLQDGGKWDFDGEANGVIADPIGLGVFSGFDKVSGGGGCFIATAAFGSPFERHVQILRQFRDRYLLTSTAGKAFVRWYYKHSPKYASIISQNEALKAVVRISLLPLYGIAYILVKGLLPYILLGLGLLLVGLRKRNRKAIVTLLMVGLFLGVTTNVFGAETNHFKVAPAEEATVIVPTTKTIGSQKVAVDFFYSFAKNPLEAKAGGKDIDLIKDQSLLNAGITMGLTENSQISLVIPYVFNQGAASPIEKDGFGDMVLSGKLRLPNTLMEGKVAIAPYIQFTTGNEDAGLGSENAAFGVKGIYDTKLNENTLFTLNLGFAYQSKEKLAQVPINHSLLFGAGLVYNLPGNSSYISTELYGRSEELFERASSPVELLVSYGQNCKNFTFTVGGGFALVDGYGASDWRLFSGLRMGL